MNLRDLEKGEMYQKVETATGGEERVFCVTGILMSSRFSQLVSGGQSGVVYYYST